MKKMISENFLNTVEETKQGGMIKNNWISREAERALG